MQHKKNVVDLVSAHPPFALTIGSIAVAQVPFYRALDACGEIMFELGRGRAGSRPKVGIKRLDSVQMKTLPPYDNARRCIDMAKIQSSAHH